jgi:hypothetical protein
VGSTVSGPPLSGQQAPRAATAPQPDPMVASMVPGGSGGSWFTLIVRKVSIAVTVTKKAAEMRIVEEATTAVKVAVDKATAEKVAANKVAVMKAAEEAMVKAAADVATMKTVDQGATAVKTSMGLVGSD